MSKTNTQVLPPRWRLTTLGECAEFINGRAYSQHELLDAGTPVLRIQNLSGGDKWYYSNLTLPQEKYCEEGDLLYAWSASFGPYIWTGPRSIFHYHIWRVVPRACLDKSFAFHLLAHLTRDLKSSARGIAMLHLTKSGMEATKIAIPPLDEQRRIAAILDQADDLRRKRREALGRVAALNAAQFEAMFGNPISNPRGWTRTAFGDIIEEIASGWSPVCLDRPASDGEWGVLKLSAVTPCEYDEGEQKALPSNTPPKPEIEIRPGDLLFTRKNTRDLVAACALVSQTRQKLMFSDLIYRIRLFSDAPIESAFIHALLTHPMKRKMIQTLAGGSAGSMPNISKEKLRSVEIELPPLSLQRAFAARVAEIDKLKAHHRAHLARLDALFASLQHRAFRGDLSAPSFSRAREKAAAP